MNPIVIIPARLAATRLPGKPLADIHGQPMIVHVWRRAVEADLGPVIIATDTTAIADAIRAAGGQAIMTAADHPSGSDRIHEALRKFDPDGRFDPVVNLQGDVPTVRPDTVRAATLLLEDPEVMIGTPVASIVRDEERSATSVVKMVGSPIGPSRFRVLYFTRATCPWGDGPLYHHIGIYAWRRAALERFTMLPASPLEKREKLEQLRALENFMRIDAVLVGEVPLGVDTPDDLDRAREMMKPHGSHAGDRYQTDL
jgi:3-deoxy-manno-octulosonate cytidylyltransferase (CMP-KDO synthetase)